VRLLAERHLEPGARRAEGLAACVQQVLTAASVRPADLSALAVVDGPGSYTSLRIGLGLARGLALLEGIPVAVAGALELVAHSVRRVQTANGAQITERMCVLLDAGPAKVYAAGFEDADGACAETREALEIADAELAALLERWGGTWALVGDGSLAERFRLDACAPAARAGELATIGARRLAGGDVGPVERVLPRYVGATGARPNLPSLADGRPVLR
jgi:tRNA threonylcarbamoyladenosine biosynthesis protein TsaB